MLHRNLFVLPLLILLLSPLVFLPASAARGNPQEGTAAASQFKFNHISTEEGLSSLEVWSVLRDDQGFIWFGTTDGLNRFDGYRMRLFKNALEDPHSLSENTIRTLYQDRGSTLWIGTWTGGLDRFDRATETFTHFRHNPDDPKSLSSDSVFAILQDRAGILWLGTRGGGLERFDPQTQTFTHFRHDDNNPHSLSNDNVFALLEDNSGALWVGTDGGLDRLDPNTGLFTLFPHDPANPASLNNQPVRALHLDDDGTLWFGTFGGGLDRLDLNRVKSGASEFPPFTHYRNDPADPQSLSDDSVFSIHRDAQNRLWVGTLNGGLNLLDEKTGTFQRFPPNAQDPQGIQAARVLDMSEDARAMWFATYTGVYMLDLEPKPFANLVHDPDDPNTLAGREIDFVYQDPQGIVWVSTTHSGLNKVDRSANQVTHYRHDANNPSTLGLDEVWGIAPSRDGGLWLATYGAGLDKFDPKTETFTHYRHDAEDASSLASNLTTDVYEDPTGIVWVGTWDAGMERFDPVSKTFTHFPHIPTDPGSLSDDGIMSIDPDRSGALWVSTLAGLNRVAPDTGTITHVPLSVRAQPGTESIILSAVHQDRNGERWVATYGNGLYHLNSSDQVVRHYSREDGLPSDAVFSILEDSRGQFWLSTSNGLARFDPAAETFRTFDKADGLPGNAFKQAVAFQGNDGEMFFGGKDGLVSFFPDQIQDNPTAPPVVITDFLLSNKSVPIGGNSVLKQSILDTNDLTLSFEDRVLSFEFAALNYVAAQKNRYRYMLEGFDKDWTEVGSDRRIATYTNLDPGEYTFRVLGSNNDGTWNTGGASVRITITPPWWETLWFRGALGFLILGIVAGGFAWQRADARRRQQQLETLVTKRTKSLQDAQEQDRTLFITSPIGIILTTFEGAILAANPAFLQLSGYTEQELLERNAQELYENPAERSDILNEILAGRPVHKVGIQLKRKDGTDYPANLNISRLTRDDGDILLGVFEDMTEQLEAERVLRESEMEKAEQNAVAAERNRLARDLHDSVTQSLYTSALIAETLPTVWEKHPEQAKRSLQQLHQLTQGALAEMRALLLELHPGSIGDRPLGDLLRQLTTALSARSHLPISTTVAGDCDLPTNVQVALYRIAQEALNNVTKHSQARRAWVNLSCDDARVLMRIVDDGIGFEQDSEHPDQLGLVIMRERAQSVGAALTITSQPGSGTTIAVEWMIPSANAKDPKTRSRP